MEKKKVYTVKTKFVFTGEFKVYAASPSDARQSIEHHCGLVLGGDIHTTTPDVLDWDFPVHPDKIVNNGKIEH